MFVPRNARCAILANTVEGSKRLPGTQSIMLALGSLWLHYPPRARDCRHDRQGQTTWSIRSADRLACLDLSVRRYHCAIFDAADAPNPELVYLNYLETCRRLGIEPVPRGRALGLIGEWIEVLTGRPEATTN